jgi:hypothetical protein
LLSALAVAAAMSGAARSGPSSIRKQREADVVLAKLRAGFHLASNDDTETDPPRPRCAQRSPRIA